MRSESSAVKSSPKRCSPLESSLIAQEYFFQVHSGTKLDTRIMRKASTKLFQSNEMIESKFSTPTMLRSGNAIPPILQWTRPHDRPLINQPVPLQPTATT